MRKFYCIIVFITIHHLSVGQSFNWANTYGSTGFDQSVAITSDDANNTYNTGRFQGTVDFDPSASTTNLQSNGGSDIFIAKYADNGDLIWAKGIGGTTSSDLGRSLAIDSENNIYISGTFGGTVDFDPGTSSTNLTATGADAFVAKYDSSGAFLWVTQFGGSNNEEGRSITIDKADNIYLTGNFSGSLTYQLNSTNTTLNSSGSDDIFNAKLDSTGKIIWVHKIGGTSSDKGLSNYLSDDNKLYLTGEFTGTVDFDPGTLINSKTSNGALDVFVLKLDTSGNMDWVRTFGGSSDDVSRDILVTKTNNVITVGNYIGTTDFDPTSGINNISSVSSSVDMFIQSLSSSGSFNWAVSYGGASADGVGPVEVDRWENIYTTGYFFGTADFDPSSATFNLSSQGSSDCFVHKVDSAGNFIWVAQLKNSSSLSGNGMNLNSINHLKTVGSFEQSADFDPTSSILNKTSNGGRDMYILSLSVCDTLRDSLVEISCGSFASPSGNYIWTTSGIYFDTLQTFDGCDSILRIDLTINSIKYDSLTIISCDSTYTSPSGNKVWNSSGIYNDTILSSAGCDSVLNINLSFNSTSSSFLNQFACDSYIAPSGKVYSSGGLFYDTIPNAAGCDSLITIFLTLDSSSASSQTVSACKSYLSPDNKTYTTSGIYYDSLQNSVGCDSIITTNLTIISVDTGVVQNGNQLVANQNNARYQWLDCNNNYTALSNDTNQSFTSFFTGNYAVEINNNSCIDTSECINLLITSLKENISKNAVMIYPNPTTNYIIFEQLVNNKTALNLRDLNGRVIDKIETNSIKTQLLLPIAKGIYFLEYIQKDNRKVVKIIKN